MAFNHEGFHCFTIQSTPEDILRKDEKTSSEMGKCLIVFCMTFD